MGFSILPKNSWTYWLKERGIERPNIITLVVKPTSGTWVPKERFPLSRSFQLHPHPPELGIYLHGDKWWVFLTWTKWDNKQLHMFIFTSPGVFVICFVLLFLPWENRHELFHLGVCYQCRGRSTNKCICPLHQWRCCCWRNCCLFF